MVSNNIETRNSIPTHVHIPSPHWRQRRNSHSDAVEITLKKTGIFRQHSPVGRGNRAKPEEASRQYSDVTLYGRRAIFVSSDVTFQDGDAVDLGKLRGGRFLPSPPFFQCLHLFSVFCNKVHIELQLYYGTTACAAFGYFLYKMQVNVRRL